VVSDFWDEVVRGDIVWVPKQNNFAKHVPDAFLNFSVKCRKKNKAREKGTLVRGRAESRESW
jgi:hypothetical protein